MGEVGVQTGLAEWLNQCIDEDARIARQVGRSDDPATDVHQQNWSPNRVLVECEMKRRIIAEHEVSIHASEPPHCIACGPCLDCNWDASASWPCETLRFMAAVYSDRPGYRAEWAPDGRQT